jgi:hypothetical protein
VPPNCVVPAFSVKAIKAGGKRVAITFEANAAGKLGVFGSRVAPKSFSVVPGTVKVKVSLTAKAKEKLKKLGKVRVRLRAVYQPDGADPQTRRLSVMLKKRR